jgi:hypothetical protein
LKQKNKTPEEVIIPGKQPNTKLAFMGGNGLNEGYKLLAKAFISQYIQDGKIISDKRPAEPVIRKSIK